MARPLNLEDVDEMVAQLQPEEQLELMERWNRRLRMRNKRERDDDVRPVDMDTFVKLCKESAVRKARPVDAVKDIREMRDERMSRR